jgi:hypothetical protein
MGGRRRSDKAQSQDEPVRHLENELWKLPALSKYGVEGKITLFNRRGPTESSRVELIVSEEHSKRVDEPPRSRSSTEEDELTVRITHEGFEETFSGSAESVWLSINRFFTNFLPCFATAQRLALNVDLQRLARDSEGIIAIAKEGPCLLVPRNKLTDNETLSLLLLANHLAHQLSRAETDAVSREELQNKLTKGAKITSTRLGELVKSQVAEKTSDEKYRITTFGLTQLQKDIIPRIRARMGS